MISISNPSVSGLVLTVTFWTNVSFNERYPNLSALMGMRSSHVDITSPEALKKPPKDFSRNQETEQLVSGQRKRQADKLKME